MINIKLDSRYSITSDKNQWILNEDNRSMWFFQDLNKLIIAYFNLKSRKSSVRELAQLENYQKSLSTRLLHLLNNVPKLNKEVKK